jgi:hypothetical protein
MTTIKELELEIEKLKSRNKKVELDKAWETSFSRRLAVALLTYIVITVFFVFANIKNPFINSIVPTLAFFISTFTLKSFKNLWLK